MNIWRGPVGGAALPDTLPLIRIEGVRGSNPLSSTQTRRSAS